jgi:hypothetical protein
MPELALAPGCGTCAVCGGSGRLSTRPTGAACAGGIDPVASALPRMSLSRDASPLHAATLTASASAAARGQTCARDARARNNSTTLDIPDPLIPTHYMR